jgi:hypothetical protein
VRAVSGGLVSPVLVHQVRAGDPLVLGAPGGAPNRLIHYDLDPRTPQNPKASQSL